MRLRLEEEKRALELRLRDAALAAEQQQQASTAAIDAAVERACADTRTRLHAAEDARAEAEAAAQQAAREAALDRRRAETAAAAQATAEATAAEATRELKAARWELQDAKHAHKLEYADSDCNMREWDLFS